MTAFAFDSFELYPTRRLLLDRGTPVRLGSRAFDILVLLVERAGELVGKDELVARVWADIAVEEANLRVHIAGLRKVLGESHPDLRFVTNIPGRGYCFVAPVTFLQDHALGRAGSRDAQAAETQARGGDHSAADSAA